MQNQRSNESRGPAENQMLLVNALSSIASAVFITDVEGKILWVNEAFCQLSGFTPEDLYGSTPTILQSGRQAPSFYSDLWNTIRNGKVWHGEVVDQRKDGSLYTADEVITPLFDDKGKVTHFIAIQHDVTSKAKESEINRYLAYHDSLTGLPNRTSLIAAHQQAIARAERTSSLVATLFIDIDGFKPINDVHGHHVGDQFLKAVGERLRGAIRKQDILARVGGDEFAMLLTDLSSPQVASELAQKILASMSHPFTVRGLQLRVGASIGIALYPEHGEDSTTLLDCADQAMYEAKRRGGNDFYVSPPKQPTIH